MNRRLEIICSPHTGYCFGVKRAMGLIEDGLKSHKGNIYSIGDVIHNPQAVDKLRSRGVVPVSSIYKLKSGDTMIIRAHGVQPDIIDKCLSRGIHLIDTTCPFVKRIHNYVTQMSGESRKIIIIGDKKHPEVRGIEGRTQEKAIVTGSVETTLGIDNMEKAGVVIQTTFPREKAKSIIDILKKRVNDLQICDTICEATTLRREATLKLAKEVDMILVVGGKESSNTKRLYQMCLDNNISARFIEISDEINDAWFEGCQKIGLTTGTSTPDWILEEVIDRLSAI